MKEPHVIIGKAIDSYTFLLKRGEEVLGEIVYASFISLKAEFRLPADEIFPHERKLKVQSEGVFGTAITVKGEQGEEIARLTINWDGRVVIDLKGVGEFLYKGIGLFQNKYIISNSDGKQLLLITPHFKWNSFHYQYDISYEEEPQDPLLMLLGIYTSNYLIGSMTGIYGSI